MYFFSSQKKKKKKEKGTAFLGVIQLPLTQYRHSHSDPQRIKPPSHSLCFEG